MTNTTLPPAKTSSSYQFLLVKSEMTVVISDLPLNWKSSNSGNLNDIPTVANNWGWNSIQQFSPSNYDTGKNYLEQPCEAVASMIAKADAEDDLKTATIHVWVSMTDIINYAKVRGGGSSFSVKDSCPEINSYFMSCFQKLYDAGRGKNSIIININAEGEFLSCQDTPKFKRVTKEIVNELRGEGYMVSWGGPLWRELFPFVDAHGRIKAKGRGDKVVAVAVMEKQLYREKTLLKCMFSSERVNELDHKATLSGIAKHEGLMNPLKNTVTRTSVLSRLTQTRGSEGEAEKFALRCTSQIGTTNPKPRISRQLSWTTSTSGSRLIMGRGKRMKMIQWDPYPDSVTRAQSAKRWTRVNIHVTKTVQIVRQTTH